MKFKVFILLLFFAACKDNKLPVIGYREIVDGKTVYATIPEFSYFNQYGKIVTRNDLKGKIHVANFFFTSCPTICPKTMRSMVRIAHHFQKDTSLVYLCYSIDFRKDSIPRLKEYYDKLQIDYPNFYLLQMPDKDELKRVPQKYLSIAMEDSTAAGGFDHSGWLLLVDKELHIRSYCLGTDDKEVDRFIKDITNLLDE